MLKKRYCKEKAFALFREWQNLNLHFDLYSGDRRSCNDTYQLITSFSHFQV